MKTAFNRIRCFRMMWICLSIFSAICLLPVLSTAGEVETKLPVITTQGASPDAASSSFELNIYSNPDGATIYIDNTMAGTTPYRGTLKPGMVSIRVEKSGYQSCEQKIKLNRNQRLSFELKPGTSIQTQSETEKKSSPPPSPPVEETAPQTPIDQSPPEIILVDGLDGSETTQNPFLLKGKAIDDSGISLLEINGMDVPLDSKGRFQHTVQLNDKKNVIQIAAVDSAGNKSKKSITIHRGLIRPQPENNRAQPSGSADIAEELRESVNSSPAENTPLSNKDLTNWYKTQYALIIGIDRYKRSDIYPLKNAVNDARAVADIMKGLNFVVTELYNEKATRQNILNGYAAIHSNSKQSDSFLFYFAGHGQGLTVNNQEKLGYLIPYDADISLADMNLIQYDNSAINLNQLNHYAKNMKAKHIALLLDSCFSGLAMKRSLPVTIKTDYEYYEDLLSRKAINILTAGDDQPVSDGTGHSPFTRAIINALEKKGLDLHDRDGYATFNQLAIYVKEKVEKDTSRKQRPQFDNLSSEDGDFIFKFR
ncbi:MAG: caspase family protein [Desulfatirhabdiaceae bacterium]